MLFVVVYCPIEYDCYFRDNRQQLVLILELGFYLFRIFEEGMRRASLTQLQDIVLDGEQLRIVTLIQVLSDTSRNRTHHRFNLNTKRTTSFFGIFKLMRLSSIFSYFEKWLISEIGLHRREERVSDNNPILSFLETMM